MWTMTNVTGDATVSVAVERMAGEIDVEEYRSTDDIQIVYGRGLASERLLSFPPSVDIRLKLGVQGNQLADGTGDPVAGRCRRD